MGAAGSMLAEAIARQRGHLFPWTPVALGTGIAVFFAWPQEPGAALAALAMAGLLAAMLAARRCGETAGPLLGALALVVAGGLIAGARTHIQAAPVLGFRYYGPVEGRIVNIDRSISDKVRITLDQVILSDTAPSRTPVRVRLSLHGDHPGTALTAGKRVMTTAHLSPPQGPVEPGGFDFQRMAWFKRLGGVGYARVPVMAVEPPDLSAPPVILFAIRQALSARVQAQIPGQRGAFAAAVLTGDRAGLSRETLDMMRATNLAHLLAISGLHMGLLTGVVFAVTRGGIALIPRLALRISAKKAAAVVGLIVAAGYLGLSGGNIATQRAFIMVAVMLTAVLLDRRALTLRSVALAALIVLAMRPEALMSPGFQMSFAATTALVWAFSGIRGRDPSWLPRWSRPALAVVFSSAVAGFATAPVGAAHFNQMASYGLGANLLSVPVMGSVVIPAAVLAACLAPVGLAGLGFWIMGLGIGWILGVAQWIAAIEGAVRPIAQPDGVVLPLLLMGMLWLILWQGRLKWAGLAAACLAVVLWGSSDRPALLVSESGALVGAMGPGGRVLNKPRGEGFAARSWLENDGDLALQPEAHGRAAPADAFDVTLGDRTIRQISARALKTAEDPCTGVDVLIVSSDAEPAGCAFVLNTARLGATGPLALDWGPGGPVVRSAKIEAGQRLWNDPAARGERRRSGGHKAADVVQDLQKAIGGAPAALRITERQ